MAKKDGAAAEMPEYLVGHHYEVIDADGRKLYGELVASKKAEQTLLLWTAGKQGGEKTVNFAKCEVRSINRGLAVVLSHVEAAR